VEYGYEDGQVGEYYDVPPPRYEREQGRDQYEPHVVPVMDGHRDRRGEWDDDSETLVDG